MNQIALASQEAVDAIGQVARDLLKPRGGVAWASLHRLHVSATLRASGREGRKDRWEDVEHGRYAVETDLPPRHRRQGFDGISIWTSGDNDVAYAPGDEDTRLGAIDTSYQVMRGWWFPERRRPRSPASGTEWSSASHRARGRSDDFHPHCNQQRYSRDA